MTDDQLQKKPFPLSDVLADSFYYPASKFDAVPIRHLCGNIFSFVYVDYGYSRSDFVNALRSGFNGYEVFVSRSISDEELPRGWNDLPKAQNLPIGWVKEPFCNWLVFQRKSNYNSNHGPSRFSFLYLCADGVSAFNALYTAQSLSPKAIAVIQPGTGSGGNWTDFRDPKGVFARSVCENKAGMPEYLLFGEGDDCNIERKPIWPGYEFVCSIPKNGGGGVGIWKSNPVAKHS